VFGSIDALKIHVCQREYRLAHRQFSLRLSLFATNWSHDMTLFREFSICLFAVAGILMPCSTRAEEPAKPEAKKEPAQTAPEASEKKAEPVKISDAAKPVLEKIREAYLKLSGIQMSGTWTAEWDMGEDVGKDSAEFESSFAAPNKFRHETKDDVLFGSTGEKLYVFRKNTYLLGDALKSRSAIGDVPRPFDALLKEKNPALLLAVTDEATPFLADEVTVIDKGADVKIGDATFTSLKLDTKQAAAVSVLVDPATGLIRQWSADLKKSLEQRGQKDVKKAVMTIDYKTTKLEAPAADAFAWAPPEGARDAAQMAAAGSEGAMALQGKPAPDFDLEDMDGKKVKLKELKGNVVLLDFWATWCGPCVRGMPILDKVVAARKDKKNFKAYAVNWEEDKKTVEAFLKQNNIGLPVLLDVSGDVGRTYHAEQGIPATLIIDKDGVVKKVMVGLHPQEELEKAIDEALKP
jgi:thiol-disulfide isomerase/thioredoxin